MFARPSTGALLLILISTFVFFMLFSYDVMRFFVRSRIFNDNFAIFLCFRDLIVFVFPSSYHVFLTFLIRWLLDDCSIFMFLGFMMSRVWFPLIAQYWLNNYSVVDLQTFLSLLQKVCDGFLTFFIMQFSSGILSRVINIGCIVLWLLSSNFAYSLVEIFVCFHNKFVYLLLTWINNESLSNRDRFLFRFYFFLNEGRKIAHICNFPFEIELSLF